nr:hypothetical protein [Bacillus wiedmannii]
MSTSAVVTLGLAGTNTPASSQALDQLPKSLQPALYRERLVFCIDPPPKLTP